MEERASLERQIRLLTALITNHKNVHGDVPACTEPSNPHGQGPWTSCNSKYKSACSQKVPAHHGSEASSSWRTKYSLVNKKPINTSGEAPANVSQSEMMPPNQREMSSVGKCAVGASESEDGSLRGKSYRTVQATLKAQSLLALNSELALKNNKLLALKEKLHKVKMARRMDKIGAMTSFSAERSTEESARKQDEEIRALKMEEQITVEIAGRTETSIPPSYRGVTLHGSTKIQHVESSYCAHADPDASMRKLQKTSVMDKIHCVAGAITGGAAGKFQQFVESSDGAHTGPEASTGKLQKASQIHKIAELEEQAKNDCVTSGKLQNILNSVDQAPCRSSPIKRSKYTWQKIKDVTLGSGCQNEALTTMRESVSISTSQVQTRVVGGCLKSKAPFPHKTLKKQRNNTPVCSKVCKGRKAKYVWVSNTVKPSQPIRSSELTLKSVSPKLIKSATKYVAMGEDGTTLNPSLELRSLGKQKKAGCCHKREALSNKYCWKATETASPSKSLYQWDSQDSYQPGPAGHRMRSIALKKAESATDVPKKILSGSGCSHYKVKSKTKIIRRTGSLSSPTERRINLSGPLMVKNRYLLTKKSHAHGKSSPTLKKTPGKGLVQISKHRLQRLPSSGLHGTTKPGLTFSSSVKSPSNNRLINTRYKIVKKNAGWNSSLPDASCCVSWKAKKVNSSSSRSPLLNRARLSSNYRFLQQRWKMKGMRCIGGVLYSVSANKLSKSYANPVKSGITSARSTVKSVKLEADFDSSGLYLPSSLTKAVAHRHIASRAVQRSLAIIRLAKQKKSKKKEYCMYYNRFGKCNRGDNCPYIHDPEKVAVCTRFLRGTCKRTDGTCPFSHKVSKDKMPVCSYYLRGICNNNNCPYSHVYVSRKAEVCRDFLKGYCPLGAKCKKKHTLVCPEFSRTGSCAQGSKCKLQHLQRKSHKRKHTSGTSQDAVAEDCATSKQVKLANKTERELEGKTVRQALTEKRTNSSIITEELSSSSNSQHWLPAFIALHSSASSEEKADSEVEEERAGEALGKPIQIKPRL
ncbi:zinc finger CCCH domain-containing protein 3 [Carcharodon carcharias]|uniref:zinc finger CCCH domain-containing protein 3 n=1 Tax=Carcharodon carcharias TaxID=13397 RepID=UPI001B7EA219|nr:zinc finger CCCH domain-containing protein 3 [Carcharodon carcharias]